MAETMYEHTGAEKDRVIVSDSQPPHANQRRQYIEQTSGDTEDSQPHRLETARPISSVSKACEPFPLPEESILVSGDFKFAPCFVHQAQHNTTVKQTGPRSEHSDPISVDVQGGSLKASNTLPHVPQHRGSPDHTISYQYEVIHSSDADHDAVSAGKNQVTHVSPHILRDRSPSTEHVFEAPVGHAVFEHYDTEYEEQSKNTPADLTQIDHSASAEGGRLLSPVSTTSETHMEASPRLRTDVLRPHSDNARVKKPSRVNTAIQPRTPDRTPTMSSQPTEEDLLLLLMRRHRLRDQNHNRLLCDLNRLRTENQNLREQGIDHAHQLEDAKNKWHDVVRKSHVREADIKAFMGKYDKLKQWAHDMHKEYTAMHAEGIRISNELTELREENKAYLE